MASESAPVTEKSKHEGEVLRSDTSSFTQHAKPSPQPDIGEKQEEETTAIPPPVSQPTSTLWGRLPPWMSSNLRSVRSWKMFFRCWISCWAALLLLIPHKSLVAMGNIAFFTMLTSLFLPPYLPFQMFCIIISTLLIGILTGWGFGSAAMRAALAARDQGLLQKNLQAVISNATAAGLNPTTMISIDTFHGTFLDTRSSIVYGCFLGLSTFIFGCIRAYAPKLVFMSIFGTIAIDIFCCIGPLFPVAHYTLLRSILISASSYAGIALAATAFIFPESMNHQCLDDTSSILDKARNLLLSQDQVLQSRPEDLGRASPLMTKIRGARSQSIGQMKQLTTKIGYLNLEFTWGKWNGDDIKELEEPLLTLVTRTAGLPSFGKLVGNHAATNATASDSASIASVSTSADNNSGVAASSTKDTYLLRQIHQRNSMLEMHHSVRIHDMLPLIDNATRDMRVATAHALGAVRATVDFVNKRRFSRSAELEAQQAEELDEASAALERALREFKESKRRSLLDPFASLIRAAHTREQRDSLPLRSLYLSYLFAANTMAVASGTIGFINKVRELTEKRKQNRLWAPGGLRNLAKFFTQRGDKDDGTFGEDVSPNPEGPEVQEEESSYRLDPDSRSPQNAIQKSADKVHALWKWSGTPEGIFTIKYVLVSIALWLPAVFKSSAQFYYDQKGVWALIMAQTTLNIYASDQIYNYVIRFAGTFVGLCFGLVTWYVGNGRGYSPYGLAASGAVFLVPIVWLRVYLPMQYLQGSILGVATFALVIGYSIVDGRLPQVAVTPGIGWTVAWKRWVLISIGALASFILMIIPPKSGRKAVRIRNAYAVMTISSIYADLLSHWITAGSNTKGGQQEKVTATWLIHFRSRLISLGDQLGYIRQLTALAKWEGNIRGRWPVEDYTDLVDIESEMITGLSQLAGALGQLQDEWRMNFLHSTKALNPHFIGDVMSMFALIAQSLRTGDPLHQVLPQTLLDRLFYHGRSAVLIPESDKKDAISLEDLQSIDYMYYASGLVAVYDILQSVDELHRVTKKLCGEVPLKGFEKWREEYERAHIRV